MDELTLLRRLERFHIETPSWGYADTGTRFGIFLQAAAAGTIEEKLLDAVEVHRYTGCCPSVASNKTVAALGRDFVYDAARRRALAGPEEATAMGNLLVQALGDGRIRDRFEIRRLVARTVRPEVHNPRPAARWDRAY